MQLYVLLLLIAGILYGIFMYIVSQRRVSHEFSSTNKSRTPKTARQCSENNHGGRITVNLEPPTPSKMHEIALSVVPGGEHHPPCHNPHDVAIIVPYRNRAQHLHIFLAHLHPFLISQNIHYKIFIVNQAGTNLMNKGMLLNIGFREALRDFNWSCFIFHDIDNLPEDSRNLYSCSDLPKHMAVIQDGYELVYEAYFGGVVALRREQFEKINGVSNKFWGWGKEDDDMLRRIFSKGMTFTRGDPDIARYTTIKHGDSPRNPQREEVYEKISGRFSIESDGLNSLTYSLIATEAEPLFTNITVGLEYL